jgi:pimeloyl-ACP methyl ester carboxylesterase
MISKRNATRKKLTKRILWTVVLLFILMNVVASFQAYEFTHFANENVVKTKSAEKLTTIEKVEALFFGVKNPRPTNNGLPTQSFETIKLHSNKIIECWHIKTPNAKGTVILFHGYSGEKSSLLDKSDEFIKLGYNTLLVDFMGSGGSEGNQTTIGFKEAVEVKTSFDYLKEKGEKNIYLFGTSMGAVAILKAIDDYKIQPTGIIIECPLVQCIKLPLQDLTNCTYQPFPWPAYWYFGAVLKIIFGPLVITQPSMRNRCNALPCYYMAKRMKRLAGQKLMRFTKI